MSRSKNSRRGIRNCRTHNRNGCDFCLHLRRHAITAAAVRAETADETVTGYERWYDWEGGFLVCG